MLYRIVWKKNRQFYTEYRDAEGVKNVLEFLESHFEIGFSLVKVEPYAED